MNLVSPTDKLLTQEDQTTLQPNSTISSMPSLPCDPSKLFIPNWKTIRFAIFFSIHRFSSP